VCTWSGVLYMGSAVDTTPIGVENGQTPSECCEALSQQTSGCNCISCRTEPQIQSHAGSSTAVQWRSHRQAVQCRTSQREWKVVMQ